MNRIMLKAKLHRAHVTGADLDYEGSITIPRELMELADILPNEKVDVYNVTNGARLSTYAIPGQPGEVIMNGAAAHHAGPGDVVILCTYVLVPEELTREWKATRVYVDENNRVARMENR